MYRRILFLVGSHEPRIAAHDSISADRDTRPEMIRRLQFDESLLTGNVRQWVLSGNPPLGTPFDGA